MSTRPSMNGWPSCMVHAHIMDVTDAVPRRKQRRSTRAAWIAVACLAALVVRSCL